MFRPLYSKRFMCSFEVSMSSFQMKPAKRAQQVKVREPKPSKTHMVGFVNPLIRNLYNASEIHCATAFVVC